MWYFLDAKVVPCCGVSWCRVSHWVGFSCPCIFFLLIICVSTFTESWVEIFPSNHVLHHVLIGRLVLFFDDMCLDSSNQEIWRLMLIFDNLCLLGSSFLSSSCAYRPNIPLLINRAFTAGSDTVCPRESPTKHYQSFSAQFWESKINASNK